MDPYLIFQSYVECYLQEAVREQNKKLRVIKCSGHLAMVHNVLGALQHRQAMVDDRMPL